MSLTESRRDEGLRVYLQYQGLVYRIARRYESDRTRREDLFQEIWTVVIKRLPARSPEASMGGWITVIAKNVARARIRKRTHRRRLMTKVRDLALGPLWHDPPTGPLGRGVEEAIWNEVGKLSLRERTVLIMRVLHDHSIAHVATSLGCSEGTVKWTYNSARKKLAAALPELGEMWKNNDL